jgi:FG-GAP-like repeat/Biotin-protein ligase, N terminal
VKAAKTRIDPLRHSTRPASYFKEFPLRFKAIILTSTFRWVVIVALAGVFAAAQTAAPGSISHLYRMQLSTGHTISGTWRGAQLQGATKLASTPAAGWVLIGATASNRNGTKRLVYSDKTSGGLAVNLYAKNESFLGSVSLAPLGAGWTARAVADLGGNGNLDVIAEHESTGQVAVHFFGGAQGTTLLRSETISPLSAMGWNVIGAADLNGDGHPDLLLQNSSTRQVMVAYLGGSSGTAVTATQELSSSSFGGWTAVGMQDMNGDGHPDLILVNDATGESIVNYYGGELGVAYVGSSYLDRSGASDWKLVVPSRSAPAVMDTTNSVAASSSSSSSFILTGSDSHGAQQASTYTSTTPILIFNGTGTSSSDVTAVENVVKAKGLAYHTANSSQLDAMSESQLMTYRLFIVPGGNSITIGNNVSSKATTTVRDAVSQGLNYLGICAGGFFGGYSKYNGLDLTSGQWFSLYADYYKGIHKEAVAISFPGGTKLDIYWQDGPQLSGWGQVIGKYPNGSTAITEGYWGKGFVLLSGVHPEAPAGWRSGMNFFTPLDVDLAFAGTLVTSALNRVTLPHF